MPADVDAAAPDIASLSAQAGHRPFLRKAASSLTFAQLLEQKLSEKAVTPAYSSLSATSSVLGGGAASSRCSTLVAGPVARPPLFPSSRSMPSLTLSPSWKTTADRRLSSQQSRSEALEWSSHASTRLDASESSLVQSRFEFSADASLDDSSPSDSDDDQDQRSLFGHYEADLSDEESEEHDEYASMYLDSERDRYQREWEQQHASSQAKLSEFERLEMEAKQPPKQFPKERVELSQSSDARFRDSQTGADYANESSQRVLSPRKQEPSVQDENELESDEEALHDYEFSQLIESSVLSIQHDLEEQHLSDDGEQKRPPPPASKLLASLFPALAPPSKTTSTQPTLSKSSEVDTTVKGKLEELEKEIKQFKASNDQLRRLRHEHEVETRRFQTEKANFEKLKQQEVERLHQLHQEEMKKLRKEKKIWERYQKASDALPSKKERQEIDELKRKVAELEGLLKVNEMKSNLNQDRLKKRIEELTKRNKELQEELRLLEQDRLAASKLQAKRSKNVAVATRFADQLSSQHAAREEPRPPRGNEKSPSAHGLPVPASAPPMEVPAIAPSSPTFMPKLKTKGSVVQEIRLPDGRTEKNLSDGTLLVYFPSGSVKEASPDGNVTVYLVNGDVKEIFSDRSWVYYYADSKVTQRTQVDGTVVFEFPDGQVERRHPDGSTEIVFPDKTIRYLFSNGEEECIFPDGTISRTDAKGKKVIEFADGVREVYWGDMKQRFEVDGTLRIVYPDGSKETRYKDGRVRVIPARVAAVQ